VNEYVQLLDSMATTRWGIMTQTGLRIVLILLLAWLVATLLRRAIRVLRERVASRLDDREAVRRAETLTRMFRHIVTVAITLVAGMMVLSELGISLAPILGAAGIAGVAIGFGAQSLVRDFFSGFFILFEDQIRTGDVVRVATHSGVVEEITLRHTRLRDYEGNVHFVPNGMIDSVVNMSRGFANAVMDVGVAYRENLDEVYAVLHETGRQLRADPTFGPRILDDLEIAGVERWDTSAVVVRCRFKVIALEQWSVRREFMRRLKFAFDAGGIEIPFPHLTVYAGQDKAGNAPAFHLRTLEAAR
jgi:small conductance mechanosensitive channel